MKHGPVDGRDLSQESECWRLFAVGVGEQRAMGISNECVNAVAWGVQPATASPPVMSPPDLRLRVVARTRLEGGVGPNEGTEVR